MTNPPHANPPPSDPPHSDPPPSDPLPSGPLPSGPPSSGPSGAGEDPLSIGNWESDQGGAAPRGPEMTPPAGTPLGAPASSFGQSPKPPPNQPPLNQPPPNQPPGGSAGGGSGPGGFARLFRRRWMRVVPAALVIVLVAVIGGLVFLRPSTARTVTAQFSRTVGVYPGSDVRILGVKVGEIAEVTPMGGSVRVRMEVEPAYSVPASAVAVVVPPSIVADRYVQLSPAYTGGPRLPDGATLSLDRTAVPVELDDLYKSLNDLNTALGPAGANRDGALSRLLSVGARNLGGTGAQLNVTTQNLSRAVQVLSDNRGDLFGSLVNIQRFVSALAASDNQVRSFNTQLASVGAQLNNERTELAAALQSLSVALGAVATFVRQNRSTLAADVRGLTQITGILVKQKQALGEILDVAPVALANLAQSYNPTAGTLDTRDDLISGMDPALMLCSQLRIAGKLDPKSTTYGTCVNLVQTLTQCRTGVVPEILKPLAAVPITRALPCGGATPPADQQAGAGTPNGPGEGQGNAGNPSPPGGTAGVPPPGSAGGPGATDPGSVSSSGETGTVDPTLGGVLKGDG